MAQNPLCAMCAALGRVEPATCIDHITAHHGNKNLYWDSTNWMSLCTAHHSGTKQQREGKRGYSTDIDANGEPIDLLHPWNQMKAKGS